MIRFSFKWRSDPRPATVTSIPINSFMTLVPNEWIPWSFCNECVTPARNVSPSGLLVRSLLGLTYAQIVETRFPELAMSFPEFSPWITLGTFSILLLSILSIYETAIIDACSEEVWTFVTLTRANTVWQGNEIRLKVLVNDWGQCYFTKKHSTWIFLIFPQISYRKSSKIYKPFLYGLNNKQICNK